MKQYRISAADFRQQDPAVPDAHLDQQDLANLQRLAGIDRTVDKPNFDEGSNISKTANEKAQLMKKYKIQPGTQEWFQLWFSKPYLTGEPPVGK
jgi:hypothetical protein